MRRSNVLRFNEDCSRTRKRAPALVTVTPAGGPASAAQRTFNRLTERIRRGREYLAAWDAFMHRFQGRMAGELAPIQCEIAEVQRRLVHAALRNAARVRDFAVFDRSHQRAVERDDRYGFAIERNKLDLERIAIPIDVHDSADVSSREFLFGNIARQHYAVVFLDHGSTLYWICGDESRRRVTFDNPYRPDHSRAAIRRFEWSIDSGAPSICGLHNVPDGMRGPDRF